MKKTLLLLILLFSSLIFPQTVTINEPQTKYTVRHYYGVSPDFSYYEFNSDHDLGSYNVAYGKWMDWVSCYKISLAGVPSGYTIKSITLTAYITQQEYTPNNFVVNISKLPNNTDLSTGSSNAEPLYNAISTAGSSIGSFKYSDTFSKDIKSSITSDDFSDNYIIIGVTAYSLDNSRAKISISLAVTYYLPLALTVDNNFVDNSGNGTHWQVSVDGTTQTVPSSGVSLTRNIGQNLTLSAISYQQDNQGYQRTWHTGAINTSDWRRNNVFKSSGQTYSFSVSEDDGGKTYMANLKKVCGLTFQANSSMSINWNYRTSPYTESVVEQNSISAFASSYSANGIDFTFSKWSTGSGDVYSPITASEHKTYTAVYTGKPNSSECSITFNTSQEGQPVNLSWSKHPLDNSSISHYAIWRKVTTSGTPTLLTTVSATGASSYSYTDYEFAISSGANKILLFYDVRPYYSPDNSYSDPSFEGVYGV